MDQDGDTPGATMTAHQFRIVFQVTKEVRGVPEDRWAAAGIPPDCAVAILRFARDVRKALVGGGVEIRFVPPDPSDGRTLRTLRIPGGPEAEGAEASSREFPADVARHWRSLVEVTVASLGTDELRFRTGYGEAEVDSASSPLRTLFAG